jgi:uncharacterized protein
MGGQRLTRVLCAADPAGSVPAAGALLKAAEETAAQAIALVGDLGGPGEGMRAVFRALVRGGGDGPVYWVPGTGDGPVESYLREAANIEIVAKSMRGLHGTAAFAPDGHVVFAGFGGRVSDDPDAPRDETGELSYPRWEPEYRLKVVRELEEHQLVLMFSTRPAHKGLGEGGSDVIAELIGTYRPRLVVCGGERGSEMLGTALVVAPGSVRDGHFAVADLHAHEVEHHELPSAVRSG